MWGERKHLFISDILFTLSPFLRAVNIFLKEEKRNIQTHDVNVYLTCLNKSVIFTLLFIHKMNKQNNISLKPFKKHLFLKQF